MTRMAAFRYALRATQQHQTNTCPSCGHAGALTVMEPEPGAPLGIQHETILCCPRCQHLAIPAGVIKRVGGLLLVIPFLALLCAGLGTALWMVWSMASHGPLDAGMMLVALVLGGLAAAGGRPAVRTLLRLLRPRSLLPLGRLAPGEHNFSGRL